GQRLPELGLRQPRAAPCRRRRTRAGASRPPRDPRRDRGRGRVRRDGAAGGGRRRRPGDEGAPRPERLLLRLRPGREPRADPLRADPLGAGRAGAVAVTTGARRAAGWAVHFYAALGAVAGTFALVAAARGDVQAAFLWLSGALAIDASDGALARLVRV